MNSVTASLLLGSILLCGAQAYADEAATSPTMVDAHSTHRKLMKECIDKEKSQNGASSTEEGKKQCRMRVKTQMQQMKGAGTMPPSSQTERSSPTRNKPDQR